jgi:hypothetical protein
VIVEFSMARLKNTILAGATIFAAMGTGFVMQSSPVAELRYGVQAPSDIATRPHAVRSAFSGVTSLELTEMAYTSAPPIKSSTSDANVVSRHVTPDFLTMAPATGDPASDALVIATTADSTTPSCTADLVARPIAAAMVDLSLTAPCEANARVTLHHNGMMITEQMDSMGKLTLQMPALSQVAIFMAAFDSGLTAMARAEVTSLDIYDRVVVQWQGPGEMQIHALEFGADYGDEGHVWAESPRSIEVAALGKGGFVTQHGRMMPDQDLRAQVYTFPSGTVARTGDIALSVETEVTAQTCGRMMEGQALQIAGGGALSVKDLNIDIPDCEAVGDFLVLKNLLQDLKIARN